MAVNELQGPALDEFIQTWRTEIITCLREDPFDILHKRHPIVAASVAANFPRLDIVRAFLHPVVSSLDTFQHTTWPVRIPSLSKLAMLYERSFSWTTPSILLRQFKKNIWPAMIVRHLLREALDSSLMPYMLSRVSFSSVRIYRSTVSNLYEFRELKRCRSKLSFKSLSTK